MSFDFDLYSDTLCTSGNVATSDGSYKSSIISATTAAATAVAYSAISWTVTESQDGITYTAPADAQAAITRAPLDTTKTATAFHVGYIGKAVYWKAVITGLTSPIYTVTYSNPQTGPTFGDSFVGIDA